MTYLIAILPAAALLLLAKLLPPFTRQKSLNGSNARNGLFFITMNKGLGKYASAIWAQEDYEIRLKKSNLFKAITRNKSFLQDMEIMGHEIETLVAVSLGADLDTYRMKEARALTGYKQFKGVPLADILARMVAASPAAARFVSQNRRKISDATKYE